MATPLLQYNELAFNTLIDVNCKSYVMFGNTLNVRRLLLDISRYSRDTKCRMKPFWISVSEQFEISNHFNPGGKISVLFILKIGFPWKIILVMSSEKVGNSVNPSDEQSTVKLTHEQTGSDVQLWTATDAGTLRNKQQMTSRNNLWTKKDKCIKYYLSIHFI